MKRITALLAFTLLTTFPALADNPFLHGLFTDSMVLQRDATVPVWGWTTVGNTVTVTVNDAANAVVQTQTAVADSNGRWQANLAPMGLVPNNDAYSVVVADATHSVTLRDVLIGDVILCSGQSNMAFAFTRLANDSFPTLFDADIANSGSFSKIRHFMVPITSSPVPQQNITGGTWMVPSPANTPNFSVTAYYTGRELYKKYNIPVGLLTSAVGSTEIKVWIDPTFAASQAEFTQDLFDLSVKSDATGLACSHFNGMIAPLAPFRVRATLWYQGESDGDNYPVERYQRYLPGLLQSYRSNFEQPTLPFVIVQLPNLGVRYDTAIDTLFGTPIIREMQRRTVRDDPNSRLLISVDIGDPIRLHPADKADIGQRASWAIADMVYGQNVVGQGPTFTGATFSGSTVRCSFSNVGDGLMIATKPMVSLLNSKGVYESNPSPLAPIQPITGGTLVGFALADTSGTTFYKATAVIDQATNTVVVTSTNAPNPVSVRYAWARNPEVNLYSKFTDGDGNLNGLPASPFQSDSSYTLAVYPGSGKGTYALGSKVAISGSTIAGLTFDHWSGDTQQLSGTGQSTEITISQVYQSVCANYRVTSSPTLTGSTQREGITLNWNLIPGVHYNLKRATSPDGPYETIGSNFTGATLNFADNQVSGNQTYYYTISAITGMGEGPTSAPTIITQVTPRMNALAAALTWDPQQTANASNGGGAWNNTATNFAASGTNVAYTPTATVTAGTFGTGTNEIPMESTWGLVPGLTTTLTQFPAGTTITAISRTAITLSASGTAALASGVSTLFAPAHSVIFGGTSGTAGLITVSGTQYANSMTIAPATSGSYTFEGGAINLGTIASGTLTVKAGATINSNLTFNSALKDSGIYFATSNQTLKLGGGGNLWNVAGTSSTTGSTSTLVLTSGTYSGASYWKIGDPFSDSGGVVVGTGTGTVLANNGSKLSTIGYTSSPGMVTVNQGGTLAATGNQSFHVGYGSKGVGGKLLIAGGNVTSSVPFYICSTGAQYGSVQMTSGTLAATSTSSISIGNSCTAANTGTASLNISGGTVLTAASGTLAMGRSCSFGTGTLNLTGGSLYLGSGGIALLGTGSFTSSINLSGGTVGALASWSSTHPMVLGTANGPVAFQAADQTGTAFDITLNGVLSGAGGLSKTGAGKLTLFNLNSYAGNTTVSEGTLALSGSATLGSSPIIEVRSGATLNLSALNSLFSMGSGKKLTGNGAVAGSLTSAGVIAPTTGALTITGSAVLSGSLSIQVNGGATGRLATSGNLDISGASLEVSEVGTFTGPYVVAESGSSGYLIGVFAKIPAGYSVSYTNKQATLHNYDSWAAANGITGSDPSADFDGDGKSNRAEFLAGTDPRLFSSRLQINAGARNGNQFAIRFPSVYGRFYRIEKSDDMTSWAPLQDNITGTGLEISGTDSEAYLVPRRFYRVLVK